MPSGASFLLLLATPGLLPSLLLPLVRLPLSLFIRASGLPRIVMKMSGVGLTRGDLDDITRHATIVKINPPFKYF